MSKAKVIAGILATFIAMPIWYYLLYQILTRVHASELMMFLFWVYLPASLLINFLTKYAEKT